MKFVPFKHQALEYRDHRDDEARALLWQMRTGKSKAVVDNACWLNLNRDLGLVIIITLKGYEVQWMREHIASNQWDEVDGRTFAWESEKSKNKGFALEAEALLDHRGLRWFCIGKEAILGGLFHRYMKRLLAAVKREGREVMLVVDESHYFGSPGSRRFKRARALSRHCKYRRILTGTPWEDSPLKAYSQFELLSDAALGFNRYDAFKGRYAVISAGRAGKNQTYERIDGYQNLDELQERVSELASVVKREDCDDMPELLQTERLVELSREQWRLYGAIKSKQEVELEGGHVIPELEAGAKLNKLLQVLSGFVYAPDGSVKRFDADTPRMQALLEELDPDAEKAVIWCSFREEVDHVFGTLEKAFGRGSTVKVMGGMGSSRQAEAVRAFTDDPGVRHLVAQPSTIGEGRNLSVASTLVWFSHTHSARIRKQANERATLLGGRNVNLVDLVAPGTVEQLVMARFNWKEKNRDATTPPSLYEILATREDAGLP